MSTPLVLPIINPAVLTRHLPVTVFRPPHRTGVVLCFPRVSSSTNNFDQTKRVHGVGFSPPFQICVAVLCQEVVPQSTEPFGYGLARTPCEMKRSGRGLAAFQSAVRILAEDRQSHPRAESKYLSALSFVSLLHSRFGFGQTFSQRRKWYPSFLLRNEICPPLPPELTS